MTDELQTLKDSLMTRREMLQRGGMGMGALALAQLISPDALAQQQAQQASGLVNGPLAPKAPRQ